MVNSKEKNKITKDFLMNFSNEKDRDSPLSLVLCRTTNVTTSILQETVRQANYFSNALVVNCQVCARQGYYLLPLTCLTPVLNPVSFEYQFSKKFTKN